MIIPVLILAIFICVSSLFFPVLRKLALSILVTAGVIVAGAGLLFVAFH
jgi:hypothetical protein